MARDCGAEIGDRMATDVLHQQPTASATMAAVRRGCRSGGRQRRDARSALGGGQTQLQHLLHTHLLDHRRDVFLLDDGRDAGGEQAGGCRSCALEYCRYVNYNNANLVGPYECDATIPAAVSPRLRLDCRLRVALAPFRFAYKNRRL